MTCVSGKLCSWLFHLSKRYQSKTCAGPVTRCIQTNMFVTWTDQLQQKLILGLVGWVVRCGLGSSVGVKELPSECYHPADWRPHRHTQTHTHTLQDNPLSWAKGRFHCATKGDATYLRCESVLSWQTHRLRTSFPSCFVWILMFWNLTL